MFSSKFSWEWFYMMNWAINVKECSEKCTHELQMLNGQWTMDKQEMSIYQYCMRISTYLIFFKSNLNFDKTYSI